MKNKYEAIEYGVYENGELKLICNNKRIADMICSLMILDENTDCLEFIGEQWETLDRIIPDKATEVQITDNENDINNLIGEGFEI